MGKLIAFAGIPLSAALFVIVVATGGHAWWTHDFYDRGDVWLALIFGALTAVVIAVALRGRSRLFAGLVAAGALVGAVVSVKLISERGKQREASYANDCSSAGVRAGDARLPGCLEAAKACEQEIADERRTAQETTLHLSASGRIQQCLMQRLKAN